MTETKDRTYRLNSSTCKRLDIIAMECGDPYLKSEIVDFGVNLVCLLIKERQKSGDSLKDALSNILSIIPQDEREKDFLTTLVVADSDINSIFTIITEERE
ncbi:MAG: hypothetical protein IJT54_05145 [Candidatus Methanomethylophilaceae archaeon]|nr:hypothetical protein [Candidatus Methanomethylophilaceae archaeon]